MATDRPIKHLAAAMKHYPSTSRLVDTFRGNRDKDIQEWPSWCFIPMAGWYAIVSNDNADQCGPGGQLPLHLVSDVGRLAALGTWRYSQGIYSFDADLQHALCETVIAGSIPSEALFRLPEWCVYIETPGRTWLGDTLHGYWAHLEHDINSGRAELRLLMDTEQELLPIPVKWPPMSRQYFA